MRISTVRRIARFEITTQIRDGRVRIAAVLMAVLCLTAVLVGWKRHYDGLRTIAAAQATTHEQFVTQGKKNPHSGAHFGVYAFRPEGPLSFFDPGIDETTGIAIFVEPHAPSRFRDPPLADKTALARFGSLTAGELLCTLFPLLILFIASPTIARERERGTLRLLLAQNVSKGELLIGKALGCAGVLATTLVPAALATSAAALLLSVPLPFARAALSLTGWALYFTLFLIIALSISAHAKTVRAALTTGISLWALLVVLLPRLANTVAANQVQTPSAYAFQKQLDATTWANDFAAWDVKEEQLKAKQRIEHKVSRDVDLPINIAGLVLKQQEDEDAPVYARAYGELFSRFADQERIRSLFSLLAPSIAARQISMAAAGTNLSHRIDFWWAVERYRLQMVRIINDFITYHSRTPDGYSFKADREIWDQVPHFVYATPPAARAAEQSTSSVLVLLLWLVAATFAGWRAGRSMSVGE